MTATKPPYYNIVHITDCHDTNPEGGLLAGTLVELAYHDHARDAGLQAGLVKVTPAEAFNTIDVGAKFAEVATRATNPERLVIAVNTAPPSFADGTDNNERTNFVLGRLKTGTIFGGTWGGHCLSYVKAQIAELYELTDSNNGSQFRSLEVLPAALVEYAAGSIARARLAPVFNIKAAVPDTPVHSHAYTIDNFGNVKLWLSDDDRQRVAERLDRYERYRLYTARSDQDGRAALGQPPEAYFDFGDESLETLRGQNPQPANRSLTRAALVQKMFRGEIGQNVLSATSSAKRWNADGTTGAVAQIATIRNRPDAPLGFKLPRIGAPFHLRLF